jgi:DNA-nicking Smr family endonuclease
MNTYEIDLHGLNMSQAKMVLDEVFECVREDVEIKYIHIVVGQGKGSETGPVLS